MIFATDPRVGLTLGELREYLASYPDETVIVIASGGVLLPAGSFDYRETRAAVATVGGALSVPDRCELRLAVFDHGYPPPGVSWSAAAAGAPDPSAVIIELPSHDWSDDDA